MSNNNISNLRINGINPLSYMGVNPYTPTPFFFQNRAPTINDSQNFALGTLWLYIDINVTPNTYALYMLVSLAGGTAIWIPLFPQGGGGTVTQFTLDDSSIVIPTGGNVNVFGAGGITTSGASSNTIQINISNGTNGQVLIGGGALPTWANITSSDGSITITNGANTINLAAGLNIDTDVGGPVHQIGGVVEVLGADSNAVTTDGPGPANLLEIDVWKTINTSSGSAVVNAKALTIVGTNGVSTSASGSTITINGGGGAGVNAQPFFGYLPTDVVNATGDGTVYTMGKTVAYTKYYDYSGGFYPGDGAGTPASFTAPATGVYVFNFHNSVQFSVGGDVAFPLQLAMNVITTAANYALGYPSDNTGSYTNAPGSTEFATVNGNTFIVQAYMSIGDTATFTCSMNYSFKTLNMVGVKSGILGTTLSGYRIY